MKRKIIVAGVIACLGPLIIWLCMKPDVEVHGDFSKQDVADLIRLGHAQRQRTIIDWSAPPPRWSIRQVTYRWKRFKFESASRISIVQKPAHKAEVIIGTESSKRSYQFVKTEQGWKYETPDLE